MPKLTIDGQEINAATGKTIIQAAHEAGITIPYYCYHPGMVVDGNCRICLVEVEKAPKLMIACKTAVSDGMIVHTQNAKVDQARKSVMEFMLANHPIDCPVCDQAGECKLQDYYYDYDFKNSRFKEEKNHKPKVVDFGQQVMFDGERCIMCSRCVRFTRDISESHELGIYQRGDRSVIGLTPGKTLDNPYSLNTVDICPVGALTSKNFRFRKRVWMLDEVQSVCTGCSRGCNVWLDRSATENKIYRLRPRKNLWVNQYWMCDAGRFIFEDVEKNRLLSHRIDGNETSGQKAVEHAVQLIQATQATNGKIALLLSRHQSNEVFVLWQQLATKLNATTALNLDTTAKPGDIQEDDFLITTDKNPNTKGAHLVLGITDEAQKINDLKTALAAGQIDLLLIFGRGADQLLGNTLSKAKKIIRIAAHQEVLSQQPTVEIATTVWAEEQGSFTNIDGYVSGFMPAVKAPDATISHFDLAKKIATQLDIKTPITLDDAWHVFTKPYPHLENISFNQLLAQSSVALNPQENSL